MMVRTIVGNNLERCLKLWFNDFKSEAFVVYGREDRSSMELARFGVRRGWLYEQRGARVICYRLTEEGKTHFRVYKN